MVRAIRERNRSATSAQPGPPTQTCPAGSKSDSVGRLKLHPDKSMEPVKLALASRTMVGTEVTAVLEGRLK